MMFEEDRPLWRKVVIFVWKLGLVLLALLLIALGLGLHPR